MANRQTFSSGVAHPSTRYWIDLIVEELEVDKDNNRSRIHFDLRARSEYTWDLEFRGRLGYIEIDENNDGKWTRIASSYTNLAAYDGDGGAYNKRIVDVTRWVEHKDDGTLSFGVKGFYDYSNILISDKWWLHSVTVQSTYRTIAISRTPTLSVSIKTQSAESVSFNWKSDIPIKSMKYWHTNIDATKSVSVSSKKSGTLTVKGLTPGTKYTFKINATSTGNKTSATKTLSVKTVAISSITSSVDLVFGSSLPIKKTNTTGFKDDLYFYVNDKLITKKTNIANSYTLKFTQAELDAMYKLFGKSNTATITATIVCKGTEDYTSSKKGTLLLTGNALTAHIGIGTTPRRAKVYIGGAGKAARRAVCWVGVNGTPRRTI